MTSETKQCLISIFMPVYNGSKYLRESIESILNQTFKDFQMICVDDSSTDNSYEILQHFNEIDSRIKIFRKPNGGKVAKSWNFVMPYLEGESIIYMSQDDLMSKDNLEQMYKRQQETDADSVLPDMVWYYEGNQENEIIAGVDGNRDIILTNREAVILSLNWKIHGFALWKSKILKDEIIPEDSFDSDEYFTRKLFFKSNKVVFCKGVFFYRQDNEQAICKSFTIKDYYTIYTTYQIYKLLEDNDFEPNIISSALIDTYHSYFKLFRFFSIRKSIHSDFEFKKIRSMLTSFYLQLNKNKLFESAINRKGSKRLIIYLIWVLFYNLSIFKTIMFFVYLFDCIRSIYSKIKLFYKSYKNYHRFSLRRAQPVKEG